MILLSGITYCSTYAQLITIHKKEYRSSYDLSMLCPKQVWWTLRASDIGEVKRNPSWRFVADIDDPRAIARHSDYTNSGYHRGHLCPAKDRSYSLDAMRRTFATSNIAPQTPALNCGAWLMTEDSCRRLAVIHDSIRVLAVPIWLDRDTTFIGRHRLAVPHAFMKAAWLPQNDSVIAVWMLFNK